MYVFYAQRGIYLPNTYFFCACFFFCMKNYVVSQSRRNFSLNRLLYSFGASYQALGTGSVQIQLFLKSCIELLLCLAFQLGFKRRQTIFVDWPMKIMHKLVIVVDLSFHHLNIDHIALTTAVNNTPYSPTLNDELNALHPMTMGAYLFYFLPIL